MQDYKVLGLTRVERGEGGGVPEIATLVGETVLEVVIVEGIRRRPLDVGRVMATAARLDRTAVGPALTTSPVDSSLERSILRVVLGHTPEGHARLAAAASAVRGDDEEEE